MKVGKGEAGLESMNETVEGQRATIVLIHGRHFKPASKVLQDLWCDTLRAGLQRDAPDRVVTFDAAQIELAYYGDLVNALLSAHGKPYDEALDVADRRRTMGDLTRLDAKKFKRATYERLPGKSPLKEFLVDFGAPLASAIGITERVVARIMPELAAYWGNLGGFGAALDQRITDPIRLAMARGDRILVISHGIGSVIAYNAFWALSRGGEADGAIPDAKVDTWITLGAPLADESVKRRLRGADKAPAERYPGSVLNWFNFAAEDDYTCHDETVGNDFSTMLEQRVISRIVDRRMYNLAVRYGRSNPHNAMGYLIHPRVISILAEWLGPGR